VNNRSVGTGPRDVARPEQDGRVEPTAAAEAIAAERVVGEDLEWSIVGHIARPEGHARRVMIGRAFLEQPARLEAREELRHTQSRRVPAEPTRRESDAFDVARAIRCFEHRPLACLHAQQRALAVDVQHDDLVAVDDVPPRTDALRQPRPRDA
jgi:hypothetical protein